MTGRYPLRKTPYRAEIGKRRLATYKESDSSSDSDSDNESIQPTRKRLQRKRMESDDDSDSDISVSDSVVHDPPPPPPRRTLNVHILRKNTKKAAPVIDLTSIPADKRRVTRSMVRGPVVDLTQDDDDPDYDITAGASGITAEDMTSESPVVDDLDQEPPPEAFTNPDPQPEKHTCDELTDEQRYIQALMQSQQGMNNEQVLQNDQPETIPEPVEPRSPEEEEQLRFIAWLKTRIHIRSTNDLAANQPEQPPPEEKPPAKPKCFINFYYTINAHSYTDSLDDIKKAVRGRMLAIHPDKLKPGEICDPRDVDIVSFIRQHVFNNEENRERYNRLIASPYYAHGSGANTDLAAMQDYMEKTFDYYQPFTDLTVKNARLVKVEEHLPRLYPSANLPKAVRGSGGSRYGGPVNIASLAQAFVPRAPPQTHYGAFTGHMAAFNNTLKAHQPHD